jgi:hypothetical protein
MANKKFCLGLLVMALIFGAIGCDTGSNAGSGGESVGITYTVTADGTLDKETSTHLEFSFDAAVSGLMLEDIIIFENTGKAEKNGRAKEGILTGSETSWALNITNIKPGKIRVQITKAGIERGRKTVAVHKDNATGQDSGQAIKLANTVWEDGYLAGKTDVRWYKFEAEAGKDYRVQWKDKNIFQDINTDRIYVKVTAWRSDLTKIEDFDEGGQGVWTSAPLPKGVSGTVYLKVETTSNSPGTFIIRFFDSANAGPLDRITIYRADAMPNLSVEVSWGVSSANYPDPAESVGFKVYRSDTKDGTYGEIADVTEQTETKYGTAWIYIDTNVEFGKTYWYKVAGYNSKGDEGDKSEPKESQLLEDIDAGVEELTVGVAKEGEMKTPDQVDWYKFTAEPGKTYVVEGVYDQGYTVAFSIYAFKNDKTPIDEFYYRNIISGESGTIYLKAVWYEDSRNSLGLYGIRVKEQK